MSKPLKIYSYNIPVCPYCGDSRYYGGGGLKWSIKLIKSGFWNKQEHQQVHCIACSGTFRLRTLNQQREIDSLPSYNDTQCPNCGSCNTPHTRRVKDGPGILHGHPCMRAYCTWCHAQWYMKSWAETNTGVIPISAGTQPPPDVVTPRPRVVLPQQPPAATPRPPTVEAPRTPPPSSETTTGQGERWESI